MFENRQIRKPKLRGAARVARCAAHAAPRKKFGNFSYSVLDHHQPWHHKHTVQEEEARQQLLDYLSGLENSEIVFDDVPGSANIAHNTGGNDGDNTVETTFVGTSEVGRGGSEEPDANKAGINRNHENSLEKKQKTPENHIPTTTSIPSTTVTIPPLDTFKKPQIAIDSLEKCPLDYKGRPDLENVKPLNHMNPEKFIMSLSPFGPNNQIRGFRDTLILAKYLNRTVILPPWVRHPSDPASDKTNTNFAKNMHQFTDLMDAETLAEYVSVLPFSKLKEKCGEGFAAALFARWPIGSPNWEALNTIEKMGGVPITKNYTYRQFLDSNVHEFWNKTILPADTQVEHATVYQKDRLGVEQSFINMDASSVFQSYGPVKTGDVKCMLWVMPFRNMYWSKYMHNKTELWGQDPASRYTRHIKIVQDMLLHTLRPKEVQMAALDFNVKEMAGKGYLGIHWRYS